MKRIFLIFMAVFTLIFFSGCSDDDDDTVAASSTAGKSEEIAAFTDNTPNGFKNTVHTAKIDENVTLHAFIASKADGGNATHIIETSDNLVIIDAQAAEPNAQEFRKYADSLKKTVARLIISHSHPDHWGGLEQFKDVSVYAFQETSEKLIQNGASVIPQEVLAEGTFDLDGVTFKVDKVNDAEADVQAVISLPNHNVVALADLLYNEVHPFTALGQFDNWINLLNNYKAGKYDLYLTGHGTPGDVKVLDNMVQYLTDSSNLVKQSGMTANEFMSQLQNKYPKWEGDLLGFSAGSLFPDDSAPEETVAFADNTPEGFKNTVQTAQVNENVTLHAFIASKADGGNATHIIETSDNLVIIDAQAVEQNAQEFRQYADSLNKPIVRLIISHSHPDHWGGLEQFKDISVYAFQETAEKLIQNGATVIPQEVLAEGTFDLDGVTFKVDKISDAEADIQAVISLPDSKVIALADLLYNEVHPFTALGQFDNWIAFLNTYKAGEYNLYLTGHGEPGNVTIVDNMVQYLTDSSALVGQEGMTASEFMTQLQTKYPKWEGDLLQFSAGSLFPEN